MKLGAWDYLVKPCNPDELLMAIEQVLHVSDLERENRRLREVIERTQGFGEIIGQSPAMHEIYRAIDALAQNTTTVLITGESGTGKELVARSIHTRGARAERPFVALNCGAVSDTLLDSQLFGHRRGAFTGAVADYDGVFQAAQGGTLFLDEIADIPLGLQVKFLRAVQEREVTPLGSTRPVRVDVRIIAATNRDLPVAVRQGEFRSDLFYRLNVVSIHLPPLRERGADIEPLVEHFIRQFSRVYGVEAKRMTAPALARLRTYEWPGNIRELQNVVERAFALSTQPEIAVSDLPAVLREDRPVRATDDGAGAPITLAEAERRAILAALRQAGGNKKAAARALGIDRQRLYRKLDKYGLRDEPAAGQ